MDSSRTRRITAGAVAVALVAGLLALVALQPASANHAGGRALEITPEVSGVTIGTSAAPAGITAKLVNQVTGEPEAPSVAVVISFEVIGGPADPDGGSSPESPDASCTITTATGCSPGITATAAGSSLIRGWIEEDGLNPPAGFVEADLEEGRLSDLLRDCTTEVGGAFEACQEGTPVPGSKAERDNTDVVFVQFTTGAAKLNCEPETGIAPHTEAATVTCSVLDANDNPTAGQRIDGENKFPGANDPDSADGGTADYNNACITGESGTCTVSIPASKNELGTATICFWVDADNDSAYTPGTADTAGDGGDCNETKNATENDNTTDVVTVEWQERKRTSLDVAPDIPASSTVGGSHTLTATALDQFGAKWTASNTIIKGEFFSGSPRDTDANTPATPDFRACNTDQGEGDEDTASCTFTYTSAPAAGTDVMCFWFDASPVMTGSGTATATCTSDGAGEKLVGGTDAPRVDVVSKSWSAAPPPNNTNNNTGTAAPNDQGYTLVGADGGIFTYGTSKFHGSTGDIDLNEPVIGLANKKGGTGYWLVAKDGGIFSFGDAQFFGSMGDKKLNAPILGMEATPSGRGYFLFAADGGIFTFGDAVFRGSTGDRKLNAPAVGMAANERGDGYWIVAQDGGIFSFGRVPFHGSTGDRKLNEPVFDMAPTGGDNGYWLVAKDGGVFSFGDAAGKFYGSAVGKATAPVIGMGATPSFNGYWIADANGAVFHFGDALFLGDRRNEAENAATVGFATVPRK